MESGLFIENTNVLLSIASTYYQLMKQTSDCFQGDSFNCIVNDVIHVYFASGGDLEVDSKFSLAQVTTNL